MTKIVIAQEPPVFLDRAGTIARAVELVHRASKTGAELIVFPESLVPGYPTWIWRLKPGGDWGLSETLHARLVENAVDLHADHLQPLLDAAAEAKIVVVCGMTERDGQAGGATVYNTVVTIGSDGILQNVHRKVMPTNPERMVWGFGDARGLKTVETDFGRIGSLICWENFMPLARYALYSQGVDVYIAPTYDNGDGWIGTLQHIAREARCWVLGAGTVMHAKDLPDDFPERERLYPDPDEWINQGDSVVIAPGGEIVAGPLRNAVGFVEADIDIGRVAASRRSLDVVGHYSRPDVFTLSVDARPQSPVEITR